MTVAHSASSTSPAARSSEAQELRPVGVEEAEADDGGRQRRVHARVGPSARVALRRARRARPRSPGRAQVEREVGVEEPLAPAGGGAPRRVDAQGGLHEDLGERVLEPRGRERPEPRQEAAAQAGRGERAQRRLERHRLVVAGHHGGRLGGPQRTTTMSAPTT